MKDRLKKIRTTLEFTQAKLAQILQVPLTTISKYERGRVKPSSAILAEMGYKLNVNLHWLLTGKGDMFFDESGKALPVTEMKKIISDLKTISAKTAGKIMELEEKITSPEVEIKDVGFSPGSCCQTSENYTYSVIDAKVACGNPSSIAEDRITGYVQIPKSYNIKADFIVTAKGNSMIEYGISPGMLVFIRKQSEYNSGDIVALAVNEGEEVQMILKRVKRFPSGNVVFQSGNGEPMELNEDVSVIGVAVFWMKNYRG